MKVLVIFGSKSDANIYDPLKSRLLNEGHEVDFRMISVHRSPELLDKELLGISADVVIAGAGLAAHLPGILASKLLIPVFGIPCAAAVGGVDAYFAISQMPFGIPVLATAPDQYGSAVDAIGKWNRLDLKYTFEKFHLVIERSKKGLPHFQMLIDRAQKISDRSKIAMSISDRTVENALNICLVEIGDTDPEAPLSFGSAAKGSDEIRIFVPVLAEAAYRSPYASLSVVRRINSIPGGLFTGINNVGNGMLAALQMANFDGAHSAFLTNAKKGYIHA
jgi:5-(carboxyamino)imidazole ribonucleotide mutase